jgi:hypothetical protein
MKNYNKHLSFALIFFLFFLGACVDIDIPPKSILSADLIYNEAGIKAYFAGIYNHLPMEDFKYSPGETNQGFFRPLNVNTYGQRTGEYFNRGNVGNRRHGTGYWGEGFKIIRQANMLIEGLPAYAATLAGTDSWIAEAKFIRAYMYFQLAKRYGGMPKVTVPQEYDPGNIESLWVKRISHADTYDFILADLDEAIAGMPPTSEAGRANKYVAAAFKSRVALTAGTTARYGAMKFADWEDEDGVLLQGIPAERANAYLKQAWEAAKMVEEGGYELHRGNADKTANYAEVWEKADANKESIFLRKYNLLDFVHAYDAVMSPPRMAVTYGDRFNPTLDWVELFDGLPLGANGHFSAFDNDGNYIVYDDCRQLWKDVEPRLKANLLLPGEVYKGVQLDMRSGIFIPDIDPDVNKFKKFSRDDGIVAENYDTWPVTDNLFKDGKILRSTNDARVQRDPYEYATASGTLNIFKMGQDGPKSNNSSGNNSLTGFHGRKYLNLSLSVAETDLHKSTQSWIEIRYAEVLLNRAEAAIELAQNGGSIEGVTLLQDAFSCINDIRDRAGANLLTSVSELSTSPAYINWSSKGQTGTEGQGGFVEAPNRGLQIVRVERYKELAFESKIYWDLNRWFTADTQINQYRKRGLFAFMFCKDATVNSYGNPEGRYIYDARATESGSDRVTVGKNDYYETIPGDELKNNPYLQKNRNQ